MMWVEAFAVVNGEFMYRGEVACAPPLARF